MRIPKVCIHFFFFSDLNSFLFFVAIKNGFEIITPKAGLWLCAETPDLKTEWKTDIKAAIDSVNQKSKFYERNLNITFIQNIFNLLFQNNPTKLQKKKPKLPCL